MPHQPALLPQFLILLGLSAVAVVVFHRLRLPPVVGFLLTGVVSGPHGLRLVRSVHAVEALAEIGVVLLLFTVGIEFSLRELVRLRAFLVGGGTLQVLLTMGATLGLASLLGMPWRLGLFLGMLVALSSTAIVLRQLGDRGEIDTLHGRSAVGILIFQDLCVVPMMLLAPMLAGSGASAAGAGAGSAALGVWPLLAVAGKAALFVAVALAAARWAVPWLLHQVVRTRRREAFVLSIVFLCFGTAWATAAVGLSLALGAFVAGLVISESEYSHQALGEILPFRDLFNSLFFVSIGMLLDVRSVIAWPVAFAAGLVLVLGVKTVATTAAALLQGLPFRVAAIVGLALAQIGEFSFVLAQAGIKGGLLDARLEQLFLAVAVGTMAAAPFLVEAAPRLAEAIEARAPARLRRRPSAAEAEKTARAAPLSGHVVVVGYGVNGRNLARVLQHVGVPFLAVDLNADVVHAERRRGVPILYGDATSPELLEAAGVERARVLVVAISDAAATRRTVGIAAQLNPALHVIVRSRYVAEVEPLLALGAREVIPEEFETSVEIFTRVLAHLLVPRDVIERCVGEVREGSYEMLRSLDASAALPVVRSFLNPRSLEAVRVEPGSRIAGRSLADVELRKRTGASAVAIQRAAGAVIVNPEPSDRLEEGDVALLLGRPEQVLRASEYFRAPAPESEAPVAESPAGAGPDRAG